MNMRVSKLNTKMRSWFPFWEPPSAVLLFCVYIVGRETPSVLKLEIKSGFDPGEKFEGAHAVIIHIKVIMARP